nr:hypothetical protein [Proteiniphilum sp. UBA5463]
MIGSDQFPVLVDHLLEIIPGIPFQCRISQQRRGVIDRPMKGLPTRSSSLPGASPMMKMGA